MKIPPATIGATFKLATRCGIVRLPSDFWRAEHSYDHDTIALYQHLICQRCVLTVTEVEEFGPWVAYNWRKANGVEYHFLMIKDDRWERA